ncbi:MAG: peptidoglycan-binding protein [Clostridia bacterium]|nr:peptidoglycan-binding protein [Clostridia bacterium]
MPYKKPTLSRARSRARFKRQLLIGGGALVALVLLSVVITLLVRGGGGDKPVNAPAATAIPVPTALAADDTPEDASDDDDEDAATPEPTRAPTPSPEPESASQPVANADRAATRPSAEPGFLPVFSRAENTEEKIIAITVDDCFQAENLKNIVDCALDNGGKLTIFPIGENVIRSEQSQVLKYAWEKGMELENHTYTHSGLYNSTDKRLAEQIYEQQMTLCHILDKEYQCHFLRPRGGDARNDQRMHMYAKQMGYYGIAHWSVDGSKGTDKQLAKGLKPGAIYLFHTTDKDWEILQRFIPWVVKKGYKLVTMNEMFGYPANETSELATPAKGRPVPTLAPYERVYTTLKKTTYSWYAYELQQKLIELGYLTGEPDGVYGETCAAAVSAYQKDHNLEVTGEADPDLLEELLG